MKNIKHQSLFIFFYEYFVLILRQKVIKQNKESN